MSTDQQNVLPTRYGLISDVLGRRCPAFDPQCMTCVAWAMSDEIERLRHDLEIQTVNATAVLQAQHERDCAVEKLAEIREQFRQVADVMEQDGRFPTTVKAIRATVDVAPVLDHRFLPDGMDPGICQKCGSTRASHRDAPTRTTSRT